MKATLFYLLATVLAFIVGITVTAIKSSVSNNSTQLGKEVIAAGTLSENPCCQLTVSCRCCVTWSFGAWIKSRSVLCKLISTHPNPDGGHGYFGAINT
jgi:hypothetical protein